MRTAQERIITITFFAQRIPERKSFEVTFNLKRGLLEPRKIGETMNPIFCLGHEI